MQIFREVYIPCFEQAVFSEEGFYAPAFFKCWITLGLIFQFHRVCESYRWAIVFDLICAVVTFFLLRVLTFTSYVFSSKVTYFLKK